MKPVSDAELTALRTEAASAVCDQDCTIKRDTTGTDDGRGTIKEGLTTIDTTKAGLAEPSASQLEIYGGKVGNLTTWIVQLPYGTAVELQDILEISGQDLIVQRDLTPRSYAILTTVLASEV
jgi:hypothetical protein